MPVKIEAPSEKKHTLLKLLTSIRLQLQCVTYDAIDAIPCIDFQVARQKLPMEQWQCHWNK
jgi:hypothetical protein